MHQAAMVSSPVFAEPDEEVIYILNVGAGGVRRSHPSMLHSAAPQTMKPFWAFASRRRDLGFGGPTRPPVDVFIRGLRPQPPACFACGERFLLERAQPGPITSALAIRRLRAQG